jgi:hypothetical protein
MACQFPRGILADLLVDRDGQAHPILSKLLRIANDVEMRSIDRIFMTIMKIMRYVIDRSHLREKSCKSSVM